MIPFASTLLKYLPFCASAEIENREIKRVERINIILKKYSFFSCDAVSQVTNAIRQQ
jgi:hypothetical protein